MIAKELKIEESKLPVYATLLDIRRRNVVYGKLWWGTEAKDEAGRFAEAVRQAYSRSRVFVNYRKNFIAIKVEQPTRHDMVSHNAIAVETYANLQGHERVLTKTALIFRIRK